MIFLQVMHLKNKFGIVAPTVSTDTIGTVNFATSQIQFSGEIFAIGKIGTVAQVLLACL